MAAALRLGLRMVSAAGRESLARLALTAVGVAVGVTLLLITLTAIPALEARSARLGWHNTSAASPATAPDAALWLAVQDHYAGENLFRVRVAALGPNPPVPPGLSALPGPGEVAMSPGLQQLLQSTPDDQLRDRFPGRVTMTIGEAGLAWPGELAAVVGVPENDLKALGAQEIRGLAPHGSFADAPDGDADRRRPARAAVGGAAAGRGDAGADLGDGGGRDRARGAHRHRAGLRRLPRGAAVGRGQRHL